MDNAIAKKAANNIRIFSAAMVEKAKSGHPGGAMGGAEFINILYSEFLNFDPSNPEWRNRDRFFLDPGHMSPMLYGVLSLYGYYSMDELSQFRQWESATPGHPEVNIKRGIENTSGPLGQGHAYGIGAAIAEKFLRAKFGEWTKHKIYSYISDGGIQEEISQGGGRIAGNLGLDNYVMFYDSNNIQLSTKVEEVTTEDTAAKYKAWGWEVISIDATNPDEIRSALKKADATVGKPVIIIGTTIMGQGVVTADGSNFEGQCSTHGQPLSASGASFDKSIENLGGDPSNPFVIFLEVAAAIDIIKKEKTTAAAKRQDQEKAWKASNSESAKKWDLFFSGKIPSIDFAGIEQKSGCASRAASCTALGVLADNVENMIVASADLSNSDKTDGFLKKRKAFTRDDFTGGFLQAGVSELTMAAIMNGMALHGGVIGASATFFVFSDYMKPAARVAALMELPVKYIWTHDAFRVGEDGPTHQPIEQEAQIRLMEKMKNHSGKNSMLVLRPADAEETSIAWKMAMENTDSPTALILSRQNIVSLPAKAGSTRAKDALEAEKGAYIVEDCNGTPDVILVASGSEVSTLSAAAVKLRAENSLKVRVVSAISEGLFRTQDKAYQESVLPFEVPTFGLSAGLPVTVEGLVGRNGLAVGMESFGYSAPAAVLDEKLGYTGDATAAKILKFLGK